MNIQQSKPLSPHLQVYRWHISMALSIAHRASGVALAFGTLLMAYWFIAVAAGPGWFADAQWFLGTIVGRIILLGFTAALVFHFLNGIRHLFYDAGMGFELRASRISGWAVVIGTIITTAIIWVCAYTVKAGL